MTVESFSVTPNTWFAVTMNDGARFMGKTKSDVMERLAMNHDTNDTATSRNPSGRNWEWSPPKGYPNYIIGRHSDLVADGFDWALPNLS